jgi:hypothetical protein
MMNVRIILNRSRKLRCLRNTIRGYADTGLHLPLSLFYIGSLYVICALIPLSCGLFPVSTSIVDYLPRDTDVPGWVVVKQSGKREKKEIETIDRNCMPYDPKMLATAEYQYLSENNKRVRVEIVEFMSSLDSFGLFSLERNLNQPVRDSDEYDYFSGTGRFFRVGVFYLKIIGENLDEEANAVLDQYHAVLFKSIKRHAGVDSFPDEMFLFADNRSTRDILYHKKGISAIPGSKELYVIRRNIQERAYKIFFMKQSSAYNAELEFHNILKSGGGSFILSKIGNFSSAVRIISEKEYLLISFYKHWIFGVLDAENIEAGNNILIVLFNEIKNRTYAIYNR